MLRTALTLALTCIICVCAWAQVFEEEREGLNALVAQVETSLTTQAPPLWSLFSPLGTLAIAGGRDGSYIAVRRNDLRQHPEAAAAFVLPPGTVATIRTFESARELMTGQVIFETPEKEHWLATFAALPDGPNDAFRLNALCIFPVDQQLPVEATKDAVFVVREWERVVRESQMIELRQYLYPDPFLSIIGKGGMELFIYVDPERHITMARYAVEAGRPDVSEMSEIHAVTNGTIATVTGKWKAPNVVFGLGEHRFTVILLRVDGAWKVAGMFMGTQTEY
jgi:hypothetical protein